MCAYNIVLKEGSQAQTLFFHMPPQLVVQLVHKVPDL